MLVFRADLYRRPGADLLSGGQQQGFGRRSDRLVQRRDRPPQAKRPFANGLLKPVTLDWRNPLLGVCEMTVLNPLARYGRLSIALHWLMVLFIAAVYATIELKGNFAKGSEPREVLKQWHFMLGLTVFALVWLRLLTRWLRPAPKAVAGAGWERALAKLVHLALYGLMIGLPLLGWLTLSAADKPIPFFGLELPALIGANKELAGEFKELHETLAVAGYWLIGLHAAAALFHHYVRRDGTLLRMLPQRHQA